MNITWLVAATTLMVPNMGVLSAAEQALPDPTRAPAGFQTGGAASAPSAASTLVLQAVLVGRGRKDSAAVIGGQLVPLGGQVGDMRLSRITEHGVQLIGPQGTTQLTLTPEAQKKPSTNPGQPAPASWPQAVEPTP